MDEVNPFVILLMFVVRCGVPLILMLGLSYILYKIGLIKEPPAAPNGNSVVKQKR